MTTLDAIGEIRASLQEGGWRAAGNTYRVIGVLSFPAPQKPRPIPVIEDVEAMTPAEASKRFERAGRTWHHGSVSVTLVATAQMRLL
jgi:hypothetical protein